MVKTTRPKVIVSFSDAHANRIQPHPSLYLPVGTVESYLKSVRGHQRGAEKEYSVHKYARAKQGIDQTDLHLTFAANMKCFRNVLLLLLVVAGSLAQDGKKWIVIMLLLSLRSCYSRAANQPAVYFSPHAILELGSIKCFIFISWQQQNDD